MSEARPSNRRLTGRVGTLIGGKWQIERRIGSGGMATVYAATHRNGLRAALKMLHSQLARHPDTRARFLREGYVDWGISNTVSLRGGRFILPIGLAPRDVGATSAKIPSSQRNFAASLAT